MEWVLANFFLIGFLIPGTLSYLYLTGFLKSQKCQVVEPTGNARELVASLSDRWLIKGSLAIMARELEDIKKGSKLAGQYGTASSITTHLTRCAADATTLVLGLAHRLKDLEGRQHAQLNLKNQLELENQKLLLLIATVHDWNRRIDSFIFSAGSNYLDFSKIEVTVQTKSLGRGGCPQKVSRSATNKFSPCFFMVER
ncbi:MAG: hypothetical protein HXX08_13585 [Chloroflexi bacterium]|uniref:Uncharacterized protein n=1 Tax=Candidatus Chlorohelix allophototropha TaxID=3003348 RepID=A0A8T7M478_9CHLR|nr:hypothetical protein [Chloroflexota bacterium]WJW70118.1 hypothetical protein OZ401_004621 [Chloroflexota bacterium L227-S17]